MYSLVPQGLYPFSETNFQDFSRTQIDFSRALTFTLTPALKISILILPTAFHTFHIFLFEFNWFPELSRTSGLFPGLSSPGNAIINFQDFPGFSGPVRTLGLVPASNASCYTFCLWISIKIQCTTINWLYKNWECT